MAYELCFLCTSLNLPVWLFWFSEEPFDQYISMLYYSYDGHTTNSYMYMYAHLQVQCTCID